MRPQTILLMGLSSLASAQTITASNPNTSQLSKIQSDILSYESSAISALPASAQTDLISFALDVGGAFLGSTSAPWSEITGSINAMITGTPSYLSGAPADVSSILKSIATADASIINKDTSAAGAGRGESVKIAAVLAAGFAVGVAVLL